MRLKSGKAVSSWRCFWILVSGFGGSSKINKTAMNGREGQASSSFGGTMVFDKPYVTFCLQLPCSVLLSLSAAQAFIFASAELSNHR